MIFDASPENFQKTPVKIAKSSGERRRDRARLCFGIGGIAWDEEKVLERYELLYEAGLVKEAQRDRQSAPPGGPVPSLGADMVFDHRRILATAMGRLRAKMKYRPVVFELMPPEFTLLEFLMRHAGHVVSKTMILSHVWEYNFDPQTNVVDVLVSRLREKIDRPFEKKLLHTVRGVGYVLRP